jgi:putative transcriptional regulator
MGTCLLIASPQMKDPFFERTVVLVWHHDENGAIGVVINRTLPHEMNDILLLSETSDIDAHPNSRVHWGGPVETGSGTAITRAVIDEDEGWRITNGISVTRSESTLSRLLLAKEEIILCLGYAGWGPGQLDAEIASGGWLHTEASTELIFSHPEDDGYANALKTLGVTPELVWMHPISE